MASPHAERPAASAPSAPSPIPSSLPRRKWLRRVAVAAAVLAAYAALGFLLAPRLLRNAIQEKGTAALHRQVTVAEVKVNPFTLAVTIRGLEVKDLDAPRLAGWESLYVRLAPWKVLRRAVGVAEIHLVRPFGLIALDRSGKLNVQDLLAGDEKTPPAQPDAKGSSLAVALDRLEIEEARLVFEDGSRRPAFQTTLGPLTIRLTDFRTHGGADSPYAFAGTTEAGESFKWSGTVRSPGSASRSTTRTSRSRRPRSSSSPAPCPSTRATAWSGAPRRGRCPSPA